MKVTNKAVLRIATLRQLKLIISHPNFPKDLNFDIEFALSVAVHDLGHTAEDPVNKLQLMALLAGGAGCAWLMHKIEIPVADIEKNLLESIKEVEESENIVSLRMM